MIRILAINSKYVHTLLSPYYLKENCEYQAIDIVQCNINQNIEDLYNLAVENNPIAVCFPTYIFNVNIVEQVCRKIKDRNKDILIVLGGPEVSYEYEDNYEYADHIIIGEGESSFNLLVNDIINNRNGEKIYIGNQICDLSSLKSPYSEEYFSHTKGKIAYFESTRGCPFNCAYCMSGDTKLRYFGLPYVFSNLDKFKNRDIRVLKFVDRTFNANREYSNAILKYFLDNEKDFPFSIHFEIAGDIINDEFLELISKSRKGAFQFEIGVQSFNENTLNAVIRKTNTNKVLDNVKKLISLGKCHVHTDLIAGLPYEDYESFKKGFNILYSIKSDMLQLGFLKVLKGSRLKYMLDNGYLYDKNPPYEIVKTPYITSDELDKLRKVEFVVDKFLNTNNFKRTINYFVENDAFDFFYELNRYLCGNSLFDRYKAIYDFLTTKNDKYLVKSLLILDYISSNNSRVLPPILKSDYDRDFKKFLNKCGVDTKKSFAVLIDINPLTYKREKYVAIVNYDKEIEINYIKYGEIYES